MSEEREILRIVTGRLDREGIAYMVTGSMAVNYHGVPRMTRDIDIVIELVVVRSYGHEFGAEERERILRALGNRRRQDEDAS